MTRGSIDEQGFLAPDLVPWIDEIRQRHGAWFALAEDTNRLCQKSLLSLEIRASAPDAGRTIIIAQFFCRVLAHAQGAVLLIERGMASQAEALCRCGLEALFTLGAVWRDEHTARELIRSDDALRLKLLRASETLGASGIAAPDPEREKARAQLIAELESQE